MKVVYCDICGKLIVNESWHSVSLEVRETSRTMQQKFEYSYHHECFEKTLKHKLTNLIEEEVMQNVQSKDNIR